MAIRLYFPFRKNDFKHDAVMAVARENFKITGTKFHTSRLRSSGQALTDVKDSELLMIKGHGGVNSSTISCEGKNGHVVLTATDLAKQLQDQGLPRTHQSILMASCNSGGTAALNGGASTNLSSGEAGLSPLAAGFRVSENALSFANNKAGECFASLLAKALGQLTYRSILVGGWPGEFTTRSYAVGQSAFYADDDSRVLAQLDHIQWYDCTGKLQ